MWKSRRDFQGVWEGWKAGIMAFHAFHTLSFPWPALGAVTCVNQERRLTQPSHPQGEVCQDEVSQSELELFSNPGRSIRLRFRIASRRTTILFAHTKQQHCPNQRHQCNHPEDRCVGDSIDQIARQEREE